MTTSQPPKRDDTCELYQLFDVLGKKRVIFILSIIKNGATSFNQINSSLSLMSGKILSDRLKILQDKGLIQKTVTNSTPVQISYHLTDLGENIAQHIQAMGSLIHPQW